jgi:YVTN family beta-propeller protein
MRQRAGGSTANPTLAAQCDAKSSFGIAIREFPVGSHNQGSDGQSGMVRILAVAALAMILGGAPSRAQNAYVTNFNNADTVSVVATASNTVTATITVGSEPYGVAATPDGTKVYVANNGSGTVSAIATASNTMTGSPIIVGNGPTGVAMTPDSSEAYVTNLGSDSVSVIATATNTVTATIPVSTSPFGLAVTPDGSKVYVANNGSNTVSVIATATNAVTATITVGNGPTGVAVTPDGSKVYVTNQGSDSVSVIATATNTVIATISVGSLPYGVVVTPDGSQVYVANPHSNTVSVIATASNTVTATVTVGAEPIGVAVTPDGTKVYVANNTSGTVSVIATASNTVTGTISVGNNGPAAFGNFIGPPTSTLTVAENGNGNGRVTSNPAGINCSAGNNQCAASFAVGTQATLTASANAGSTFAGWSSGGCGGTGTCVVILNTNTTATASFVVGTTTSPLVASVMPSSQSVEVGTTATATATLINGGSTTASQCAIAPIGTLPATFSYQAVAGGRPNTPVNIPAGGTASFNISLTPTAAIAPGGNVTFSFACANIPQQATVLTGINTLFLSAATTPVANIITTAAVANNSNGILALNQTGPNTGSAEFSVSTTNQGIGASITASANTGPATLPVTLTLCQTDPTSGQCLQPPGPSVTLTINAGDTPTFAVFVSATGAIPFDLNNNRIFVQFTSTTSPNATPAANTTSPSAAAATATTLINGRTSVALFTPSNPSSGLNPLVAAVLPLSRSVEAGATPTAFATIINPNSTTATSCSISPYPLPVNFLYQTTDPTTNALTGTANTPVDIAAGQAQSFVVALNPTAVFGPTNLEINFGCNNAGPAAINQGVNTLSLSAAPMLVPDVIALAASADPGYVDIPGATGTGVFAVATVNLGIDATITAAANTGAANLPVTLAVCQTNPVSGACLAPPTPNVTTDIQPNATPTFGIFATGSAAVANSPGVNRVFVTFTDSGGVLRGETSVAVRTQ